MAIHLYMSIYCLGFFPSRAPALSFLWTAGQVCFWQLVLAYCRLAAVVFEGPECKIYLKLLIYILVKV